MWFKKSIDEVKLFSKKDVKALVKNSHIKKPSTIVYQKQMVNECPINKDTHTHLIAYDEADLHVKSKYLIFTTILFSVLIVLMCIFIFLCMLKVGIVNV